MSKTYEELLNERIKKLKRKNKFSFKKLKENKERNPKIIVSLTSIPKRFNTLYLTLESIFNQSLKPDKVILYLGENVKDIELPKEIKKLIKRGLQIEYRDDTKLRPHTKYFYALQEYKNDIVITFDDDIVYNENLIKELYESYLKHPKCISAVRPHKVTFDDKKKIKKYAEWLFDYTGDDALEPSYLLCQTGVGGVLYPPHIFPKEIFNKKVISENFINNDDLYLYFNQIIHGIKVVRSSKKAYRLGTIEGTQEAGLLNQNLYGGANDKFIKEIMKYYNIKYKDFYK